LNDIKFHNIHYICRIKTKKTQYRPYDYAYIALWDSSFRPTAINIYDASLVIYPHIYKFMNISI
jgi:hypothetical protein